MMQYAGQGFFMLPAWQARRRLYSAWNECALEGNGDAREV